MNSLLDESDTVLCVIDVQPGFLAKLNPRMASETVDRIRWLIRLAAALAIPIVVTEEDPASNGPTVDPVVTILPGGTERWDKTSFGLADQPDLLAIIKRTGRQTTVLCGLETDVCVAHSALGLRDRGYRVAVVADAVASPGSAHAFGLDRMHGAGIALLGAKGVAYEWLRNVGRAAELSAVLESELPPGIIL